MEHFETSLHRRGAARAPNGADYKITVDDRAGFIVERCAGGERQVIVGFNGVPFESIAQARHWAKSDGRLELPGNRPVTERRRLA